MTRPRITVVDVPVKAMTTKRKAAGKPKSWPAWIAVCAKTGLFLCGQIDLSKEELKLQRWSGTGSARKQVADYVTRYDQKALIVRATLTLDPPKPQRRRKA